MNEISKFYFLKLYINTRYGFEVEYDDEMTVLPLHFNFI